MKIHFFYKIIILSFLNMFGNTENIILNDHNFVNLIGPVTSNSVDAIIWEWNTPKMQKYMNEKNHTILYINSPGGYVQAGSQLIQFMSSLQNKNITIDCIGQNFMSMAFNIFQSCNNRYILDDSIGMQHQMSFGLKGNIESIRNYFNFHDQINNQLIQKEIDRIGISKELYMQYIINDWWIYGLDNIKLNTADKKIFYLCDSSIHGVMLNRKERMWSEYYYITYFKCPLYKNIDISNSRFNEFYDPYQYQEKVKFWIHSFFS